MTLLTELRDSCASCVCKHLSQALVLMQEVPQGYPKHHWIAVGHLGEAADEAIKEFPKLAAEIRKHRIKYMADPNYSVPILDLIEKASKHVKHEGESRMSIFNGIVKEDDAPSVNAPAGDRQGEREARQRRMAQKRELQVRRGSGVGMNRMAYRPRKHALSGPKKLQRWNETPPEPRQIARAGAELSRKYAMASTGSVFDSIITERGLTARKEEAMSIFDSITERELPEAFKKNWGRFSSKAKEPETDDVVDDDGDDSEVEESSIFHGIVRRESVGSVFDGIIESKNSAGKSVFDGIAESKNQPADAGWDDRIARTLTLSEELVEIRTRTKK